MPAKVLIISYGKISWNKLQLQHKMILQGERSAEGRYLAISSKQSFELCLPIWEILTDTPQVLRNIVVIFSISHPPNS